MGYKVADKVANLELSATDEVDNIVKRMRRAGIDDIISLGGASLALTPPRTSRMPPSEAMQAGKTKYEPTTGDLRTARGHRAKAPTGEWHKSPAPEDIIVTPGGKFAIYLAFQAMLEPGDRVMVLEPAWVSYKSMAQLAGAELVTVDCQRQPAGSSPTWTTCEAAMDGSVKYHRHQLAQQSHRRGL